MEKWLRSLASRLIFKRPRVRRAITNMVYADETVEIRLYGVPLFVHKRRDSPIWRAYSWTRSMHVITDEGPQMMSLALMLRPEDVFIDVGANAGIHVAAYAKLAHIHPKFELHAFEPNPDTFSRLERGLRHPDNADIAARIHLYNQGVSNADSTLEFVSGAVSHEFGVLNARDAQIKTESIQVKCVRLDHVEALKGDRSIVIKLDVEGHELEALQGASGLFDAGRVKAILIDGYGTPKVPEFLTSRGFKLFNGYTMMPLAAAPTEGHNAIIGVHPSRI